MSDTLAQRSPASNSTHNTFWRLMGARCSDWRQFRYVQSNKTEIATVPKTLDRKYQRRTTTVDPNWFCTVTILQRQHRSHFSRVFQSSLYGLIGFKFAQTNQTRLALRYRTDDTLHLEHPTAACPVRI
jgi:hypothetical protein